MASVKSNYGHVSRAVFGLTWALSPRRRTPGGKYLGDEYADTIGEVMRHRTADEQQGPEGRPLPPLNARYKARKVRQGHDPRILVRTHEMLEPRQVRGQVQFGANHVSMTAGLDEETKQKVEWASKGSKAQNRPPRRFYALGRDGIMAVRALARESLSSAVREAKRS
jgi:hypothetical protein